MLHLVLPGSTALSFTFITSVSFSADRERKLQPKVKHWLLHGSKHTHQLAFTCASDSAMPPPAILRVLPGADVKVTFKGPSSAAGRSAGELAVQGSTDDSGTFSLGPLYDDAEYAVEVSKPGHIFTPAGEAAGQLKFTVKQLAQVTVNVELPTGAEPSAVFLSLSGSGGFKNNARLGADKTLTFFDLQPGTYYLKPLLREHQFDPPVADLVLTDGQAVEVTLTAVRTAWGISGAVKSGM